MIRQYEIRRTALSNDSYPKLLASIAKPPLELYYMGDMECINAKRSIAVIGSRRASEQGMELAFQIGYALGRRGINVVNGLALGCDTYALQGVLAAGGTCAAVMPCGLDRIVPHSNIVIADKLLSDGGCLISEYPVQRQVRRYQYVQRDRLQSGISDGVLVIEAECDSGTMHTVRYAIKQGRRLACIDSRLIKYTSGNRWIEDQKGTCVIRCTADFNRFIGDICIGTAYRQMRYEEFV